MRAKFKRLWRVPVRSRLVHLELGASRLFGADLDILRRVTRWASSAGPAPAQSGEIHRQAGRNFKVLALVSRSDVDAKCSVLVFFDR